mmetsp:Transcript_10671/g.32316  ORF Transcript_10671/g.32316 Transcript_10671/m.32316 type:complete len:212 (-) Transcript_10671:1414-2049(-)
MVGSNSLFQKRNSVRVAVSRSLRKVVGNRTRFSRSRSCCASAGLSCSLSPRAAQLARLRAASRVGLRTESVPRSSVSTAVRLATTSRLWSVKRLPASRRPRSLLKAVRSRPAIMRARTGRVSAMTAACLADVCCTALRPRTQRPRGPSTFLGIGTPSVRCSVISSVARALVRAARFTPFCMRLKRASSDALGFASCRSDGWKRPSMSTIQA